MFDIGWAEFFFIGVIALIVIGPKDMPAAMRGVARVVGKLRGLSREFQSGMADMMREAELDDLKRKMDEAANVDPARFVKDQVDPSGSLTADFDPREFARAVSEKSTQKTSTPSDADGASRPVQTNPRESVTGGTTSDPAADVGGGEPGKPASQ